MSEITKKSRLLESPSMAHIVARWETISKRTGGGNKALEAEIENVIQILSGKKELRRIGRCGLCKLPCVFNVKIVVDGSYVMTREYHCPNCKEMSQMDRKANPTMTHIKNYS